MQGTRDQGNEGTRRRARIELLASLDAAEQALDAGEGEEYTVETLPSLVESIKARADLDRPGKGEIRILRIIHGARDAYAVFDEEA